MSFLSRFILDFIYGLSKIGPAASFIKKNKLWKGILEYGWVSKILFILGLVLGMKFVVLGINWWTSLSTGGFLSVASSMTGFLGQFFSEGYNLFFLGGMKYFILILMEVFIFHFLRKTIQILTGKEQDKSLQAFINAEIRMIKISFQAWIMETIISILIKVALGIFGLSLITPLLTFGVQCYFLGLVVLDNYFELFGFSIKSSMQKVFNFSGISAALGFVMYVILLVPVVGAVAAPVIGSVAAALALHDRMIENPEPEKEMILTPV